jgi:hypothetical protein
MEVAGGGKFTGAVDTAAWLGELDILASSLVDASGVRSAIG